VEINLATEANDLRYSDRRKDIRRLDVGSRGSSRMKRFRRRTAREIRPLFGLEQRNYSAMDSAKTNSDSYNTEGKIQRSSLML